MKHYAGLDVSLDETRVCTVDEAGAYVAAARVASESTALAEYLHATGLSSGWVGLETGRRHVAPDEYAEKCLRQLGRERRSEVV